MKLFSFRPILLCIILTYTGTVRSFIYITSLYNEKNGARLAEYIECLEKNLNHPLIEGIHILYDTSKDDRENKLLRYLQSKPVTLTYRVGRPSYGTCFTIANSHYPNKKIIVSNADIYFNQTLASLDKLDLNNIFVALTRWNIKKDGQLEIFKQYDDEKIFRPVFSSLSQDAWIFKTPLVKFENDSMQLGTMRCDSLIAFQAYKAGLTLINPCLSVQALHLHMSNIRNYDPSLLGKGEVKPVAWTHLIGADIHPVSTHETLNYTQSFIASPKRTVNITLNKHKSAINDVLDVSFLEEMLRIFQAPLFAQTYALRSHNFIKTALLFETLHISEDNVQAAAILKNKFSSYDNIKIHQGPIAHFFKRILPHSQSRIIYFNEHIRESSASRAADRLIKQLEKWAEFEKSTKTARTILIIDHLRLLGKPSCYYQKQKPNSNPLNKIIAVLLSVDSDYKIAVVGDLLIAFTSKRTGASPLVEACTMSRLYDGKNFSFKDIIQAEEIIAETSGPELEALHNLRNNFTHNLNKMDITSDAYYFFWRGLTLLKQGKTDAAHQEFVIAQQHGLNDWRIHWYLARSQLAR